MGSTAEKLREPDLLRTYLRALSARGGTSDLLMDDGRQIRTCPNCGARTVFRPEGSWYRCTSCAAYA